MAPDGAHRTPHRGTRVHVDVPSSPARPYDVVVGAGMLDTLPARLGAAAPARAYAIVTPAPLADLYGSRLLASLTAAGVDAHLLPIPDGEGHKTRATWADLTDRMLALRLGRDCAVVALGGGVTGDIAGFVAATYMRGVPVVQVPTTLLSMIDASIGGKTGVDTEAGQNLVGAFHPPRLVLVDPLLLRTLPPAELRSGMAEAVKHGAILDRAYFEQTARDADAILSLDADALERLVARSVELKAAVVTEDPYERGRRAILNFGHTVGHALERAAGYALPHGLAVAAGMVAEAALGEAVGITEAGTAQRIDDVLRRFDLRVPIDLPAADVADAMRLDKKARGGVPRFVLLRTIGACAPDTRGGWTHAVPDTEALRAMELLHQGGSAV